MSIARLYYRLKPFLPDRLRFALRRAWARHQRGACSGVWPVDPGSAEPPPGWLGWPEGKDFAFVLTHDIEAQAGVDRVRALAELEMEFGFRSSFNFIPEGPYRVPGELRRWLVDNGFEVGVHDLKHDGHLYSSREGFRRKSDTINRYLRDWDASGFRSGFMLRELDWLHDLKVLYDASTFDTDPFEPQPDGVGTIFPFWVPAPRAVRAGGRGYVELPYTLPQDSTLFLILGENSSEIWLHKLDWIAANGGMALVNVHPDYVGVSPGASEGCGVGVSGNGRRGTDGSAYGLGTYPEAHYRSLLERVQTAHHGRYWHALPKDLAGWYSETLLRHGAAPGWRPEPGGGAGAGPLEGKRAAVLLYSYYPADPRPRRAAEAMVAAGMEIDLLCLRSGPEEPKREQVGGVNITRLNWSHRRSGKLTYIWKYSSFIAAAFGFLARCAVSRRYDLIHVHNMPDVLVFSALVPRLRGAKVLLDLHDPMPELMRTIFGLPDRNFAVRLLKVLERASIAFSHSVVTVNETCRKIFGARSCDIGKIQVVMNSPDEAIFSFREPSVSRPGLGQPFVVMYHGSLVERNGLALAVEAVAKVREQHPATELWVYGEQTAFLDRVLADAEARGWSDGVRYLGSRSSEGIAEAIDGCHLGVVPNLKNIFTELNTPTRIFEFLFRGKPVVAPSAPGIHDYFTDDDLISFELGEAGDLAQKIQFAIENPERVVDITRRGQAVCLSHRWSEEKQLLLGLVSDLVGSPPAAARPTAAPHPSAPARKVETVGGKG